MRIDILITLKKRRPLQASRNRHHAPFFYLWVAIYCNFHQKKLEM